MKQTLAVAIFALFVVTVPAFAETAHDAKQGPALQTLLDLDEKLPAALQKAERIPQADYRDATLIELQRRKATAETVAAAEGEARKAQGLISDPIIEDLYRDAKEQARWDEIDVRLDTIRQGLDALRLQSVSQNTPRGTTDNNQVQQIENRQQQLQSQENANEASQAMQDSINARH
jgi:hypothetical protein